MSNASILRKKMEDVADWHSGIASASGTEAHRFESRQGVMIKGLIHTYIAMLTFLTQESSNKTLQSIFSTDFFPRTCQGNGSFPSMYVNP
jgi:hypothetical protein